VETIAETALAKDRDRRYSSAAEFARDLRRHLTNEPIAARPPDTWYKLQVFTRRHHGLVIGMATALLLLIAGIVATSWQAVIARQERRVAELQAARTDRINLFFRELIQLAKPKQAKGKELSLREALDAAAEHVGEGLKESPDIEGTLRLTIGTTYCDLGVYDKARDHLEAAVKLLRTSLGPDHSETLGAMNNLALVYKDLQQPDRSEPLLVQVLDSRRRSLGEEHPDTLQSINNMAMLLWMRGRPAEAEPLMREAVTLRRRILGANDRATLVSLDNLGKILAHLERYDEAEKCYREALQGFATTAGLNDPDTLTARDNLANLLRLSERLDEAIEQFQLVVAGRRDVLGSRHLFTAGSMQGLARSLLASDRPQEAETLLREVITIAGDQMGGQRLHATARGDLGRCLTALKRFGEAETELQAAQETLRESEGESSPATLRVVEALAELHKATDGKKGVASPVSGTP
jgi:tetratricopeptide (TPR) repeat protein